MPIYTREGPIKQGSYEEQFEAFLKSNKVVATGGHSISGLKPALRFTYSKELQNLWDTQRLAKQDTFKKTVGT